MSEKTAVNTPISNENKYTKNRILTSETYKNKRDLLNVLLDDNKEYTKADVNKLIDGYLKRRVV